jgi:Secretion system C-terminal sorting domain
MRPFFVGEMNDEHAEKSAPALSDLAFEKQVQLAVMPNPFSQSFRIQFTLPQSSDVMVNLYDGNGKLVKKLSNRNLVKGRQILVIDGTDLVNGMYYCEIMINRERIVRKMVLQK